MTYTVNNQSGVVHAQTCPIAWRSAYSTVWTPSARDPDDRPHQTCLPDGLPS